jgi:hypothetical protein
VSPIATHMPVLYLVKGRWGGTYTETAPDGTPVDRYRFALDISFPEDGDAAYRQVTRYDWDDGRHVELVFDAAFAVIDGQPSIWWDHEVMHGRLYEVDDRTLHLRFAYKDGEGIEVQESMFVAPDGSSRMRTWHWFRHGVPYRKTIVDEWRTG